MFTDDTQRKKYFDFKRGENKKNFMAPFGKQIFLF